MNQDTKDRRIAAAEKEIAKATAKREKAQAVLDSTETTVQDAQARLEWLQSAPVTADKPAKAPELPFSEA